MGRPPQRVRRRTGSDVDTTKTPAEPPKVFTEADLAAAQGGSVVETTYDGATDFSLAGGSKMGSAQLRSAPSPSSKGSGEAYWRDRLAAAKAAVVSADNRVAELVRLQGILNEAEPCQLGVDGYESDPRKKKEPTSFDEKTRQREKFCKDYSAAVVKAKNLLAQLDTARQSAEQAKKALADLPDEARRAGAMPGWLR